MQFHVDMISVFSSGPLTQIMINCTPGFLEGVCDPLSLLYIWLIIFCLAIVEMNKAPSELHYRGDEHGTLAIVADG